MTLDTNRVRRYLQNFDFSPLFIEELGWDNQRERLDIRLKSGDTVSLQAIAEKRGLVVYELRSAGSIPDYATRRQIDREVTKKHYQHLIIYTDAQRTQQTWQWVKREHGKPATSREERYERGNSGERLMQKLRLLVFTLEEEAGVTGLEVSGRVRAAFDVERVTKRFYDRFKREHDAFLAFIKGIPDSEFQRWYASVMLNRLMFVYFIQKKGFLDGDLNYLFNRLRASTGNFYRDFLCPLFFEGFANREHSPNVRRLLGDVPYLNGGLFAQHEIEKRYGNAIQIPNRAFEDLFGFFNGYQWHLDDRPLRADNEINPDVLGYIFEKYINQKQMGAYYSKEDITEYISQNTVIPYLFDQAREECRVAFEPDAAMWQLLKENPDRYIYDAVCRGVHLPLPADIAAGLADVSKRGNWNLPAPEEYALPTEIWREVVTRRQRHAEVREKLLRGEITSINDFITYNLNIRQFAQDVIINSEGPELLRVFWKAINRVTVLDPTCGSGAFLFAALNILEPLYEACLERMESFLAEPNRGRKYSDFQEVIDRIGEHANVTYFVLKSIIVNNLYGVDIMEEAVEICKLRLFLKMIAQVNDKRRIEPLPDIDFNIRAGNTVVGFTTQEDVKRAIKQTQSGQIKMPDPKDAATLALIEEKAGDIDRLFTRFRQQQTKLGGEVTTEDKAELQSRLKELNDELNQYLGRQYNADIGGKSVFEKWLKSHQPFHWFTEFYGTIREGGFDVIIGNPPYIETSKVREYKVLNFNTESCGNTYAWCVERSYDLLKKGGSFGMIVPLSGFSTDRMAEYQELLMNGYSELYISYFSGDAHPAVLFNGVKYRLCIIIGDNKLRITKTSAVHVTGYQRFYADERPHLFPQLMYTTSSFHSGFLRFGKLHNRTAQQIVTKMLEKSPTIHAYTRRSGVGHVTYHRSPVFWIRSMDFEPYFRSATRTRSLDHLKDLYFSDESHARRVGAILNSTCFYFWFSVQGNCRNVTGADISSFPIGDLNNPTLAALEYLFIKLMEDLRINSERRIYNYSRSGEVEYDEFYPSKSKHLIDQIDRVLAQHFGFSNEELDFIINYDIKYRMGRDGMADDQDDEE